jgi:hypothetical protein
MAPRPTTSGTPPTTLLLPRPTAPAPSATPTWKQPASPLSPRSSVPPRRSCSPRLSRTHGARLRPRLRVGHTDPPRSGSSRRHAHGRPGVLCCPSRRLGLALLALRFEDRMLYEIAHNAMCKDRSISCADSDVARVSFPVTSAGGFRNYPAGWLTGGRRAGGRADSFLGKLGSQACESRSREGVVEGATGLADVVAGGAHSSETGPIFSPGTDGCALLVVTFTSSLSTTLRGVLGAAAPSEGHLLGLLPPVTSGWVGGSLMEAACGTQRELGH